MKKIIAISMLVIVALNCYGVEPSPTPQPDKLKNALAEIIVGVTQTAGQAKDFLVREAPEVVKQLLMWKMVENLLYCVTGILICVFLTTIDVKWQSRGVKKGWDEDSWFYSGILIVIGNVILGICALNCINLVWLQIWLAPKVYLIEYARSLVK